MIYFIQEDGGRYAVKIGWTEGEAGKRLADLQTGCPSRLVLLGVVPGDLSDEKSLHVRFAALRVREDGEWFHPGPSLIGHIIAALGGDKTASLMAPPVQPVSPLRKAAEWLVERFREKPAWNGADILSLARVAKINKDDLAAAKRIIMPKGDSWEAPEWWPLLRRGLDDSPALPNGRAIAVVAGKIELVLDGEWGDWTTAVCYTLGNVWPMHLVDRIVAVPDRLSGAWQALHLAEVHDFGICPEGEAVKTEPSLMRRNYSGAMEYETGGRELDALIKANTPQIIELLALAHSIGPWR